MLKRNLILNFNYLYCVLYNGSSIVVFDSISKFFIFNSMDFNSFEKRSHVNSYHFMNKSFDSDMFFFFKNIKQFSCVTHFFKKTFFFFNKYMIFYNTNILKIVSNYKKNYVFNLFFNLY